MILVLGSVIAQRGCISEALALSQEHVLRSRAEPGCIAHAVHQDSENPQRLVFVEQWASQAALWEHFKVPASRSFTEALGIGAWRHGRRRRTFGCPAYTGVAERRTEWGLAASSMRLRTATPTTASVRCAASPRERSRSPMIDL